MNSTNKHYWPHIEVAPKLLLTTCQSCGLLYWPQFEHKYRPHTNHIPPAFTNHANLFTITGAKISVIPPATNRFIVKAVAGTSVSLVLRPSLMSYTLPMGSRWSGPSCSNLLCQFIAEYDTVVLYQNACIAMLKTRWMVLVSFHSDSSSLMDQKFRWIISLILICLMKLWTTQPRAIIPILFTALHTTQWQSLMLNIFSSSILLSDIENKLVSMWSVFYQ